LKAERERFNLVVQKFAQPAQPQPEAPKAPEIPDLATDPAGHILATLRATGMSVEQLAQAMQQNTQRQRESEAVAELQTYAAASEQQYRAETPDYDSAVTFLIEKRNKLLEAGGMVDPAQRLAQINREKLQLAHDARRAGKNPAAMAYEVAQIYGWAPQAAAARPPPIPRPNPMPAPKGWSASRPDSNRAARSAIPVAALLPLHRPHNASPKWSRTSSPRFWRKPRKTPRRCGKSSARNTIYAFRPVGVRITKTPPSVA
jgi:hypothetical protein